MNIIKRLSLWTIFVLSTWVCFVVFSTEYAGAARSGQRDTNIKLHKARNLRPIGVIKRKTPKAARADLKVTVVLVNPIMPRQNVDYAKITAIVQNIGGTKTSAKCSLNMSIWSVDSNGNRVAGKTNLTNRIPMYANNIVRLDPGQKTKISTFHTFQYGGRHMVYGHINTESLAAGEEKSQNNHYEKIFSVKASRPDLVICFKKSNVSKRYAQNYYPVKIKNIGEATSTAGCKLFFQINDKGTQSWTLPAINKNQILSRQRKVYWGYKGLGVHSFQIRIACPTGSGEFHLNNKFEGHIRVRRLIDDSSDGWSNSPTVCSDTF